MCRFSRNFFDCGCHEHISFLETFVRRQYGGECICRLPLIAEEEAAPSSVEVCKKCGKERKIYEDEVEFGTSRAEVPFELWIFRNLFASLENFALDASDACQYTGWEKLWRRTKKFRIYRFGDIFGHLFSKQLFSHNTE